MLGGLMGITRDLEDGDDAFGHFEQACERQLGEKIRADDDIGHDLWSALANVDWKHPEHGEIGYSFRAAGDLVAALKRSGDYLNWYCQSECPYISTEIEEALGREGWTENLDNV